MATFAEFWALVGHLPDDTLSDFVFAARVLRKKAALLFREVHHDGTRFEDADRCAAALGRMIDQHRHAMIGVHLQEFGGELIAASDVAGNDVVIETKLFEQNRDFLPFGVGQKWRSSIAVPLSVTVGG